MDAKICKSCGGVFYKWIKEGEKYRPDCKGCEKILNNFIKNSDIKTQLKRINNGTHKIYMRAGS